MKEIEKIREHIQYMRDFGVYRFGLHSELHYLEIKVTPSGISLTKTAAMNPTFFIDDQEMIFVRKIIDQLLSEEQTS